MGLYAQSPVLQECGRLGPPRKGTGPHRRISTWISGRPSEPQFPHPQNGGDNTRTPKSLSTRVREMVLGHLLREALPDHCCVDSQLPCPAPHFFPVFFSFHGTFPFAVSDWLVPFSVCPLQPSAARGRTSSLLFTSSQWPKGLTQRLAHNKPLTKASLGGGYRWHHLRTQGNSPGHTDKQLPVAPGHAYQDRHPPQLVNPELSGPVKNAGRDPGLAPRFSLRGVCACRSAGTRWHVCLSLVSLQRGAWKGPRWTLGASPALKMEPGCDCVRQAPDASTPAGV